LLGKIEGHPVRTPWFGQSSTALESIMGLNVWTTSGTMMLFYLATLQSIPTDVYEAAAIDGTSRWRTFWKITFPLLKPGHFFVRAALYAILLAIALFYLWPFFWTISTSFKTLPESAAGLNVIPHHVTLKGYRDALFTGPFATYLKNSAIFAVTVTLTNLFLCTLGGYAFARLR